MQKNRGIAGKITHASGKKHKKSPPPPKNASRIATTVANCTNLGLRVGRCFSKKQRARSNHLYVYNGRFGKTDEPAVEILRFRYNVASLFPTSLVHYFSETTNKKRKQKNSNKNQRKTTSGKKKKIRTRKQKTKENGKMKRFQSLMEKNEHTETTAPSYKSACPSRF